jgi:hypothetical protein
MYIRQAPKGGTKKRGEKRKFGQGASRAKFAGPTVIVVLNFCDPVSNFLFYETWYH